MQLGAPTHHDLRCRRRIMGMQSAAIVVVGHDVTFLYDCFAPVPIGQPAFSGDSCDPEAAPRRTAACVHGSIFGRAKPVERRG
jgi:hypothetical protein